MARTGAAIDAGRPVSTLISRLGVHAGDGASREALMAAVACGMAAWDALTMTVGHRV